jgi:sugar-specific transcriptional regulator TrmB
MAAGARTRGRPPEAEARERAHARLGRALAPAGIQGYAARAFEALVELGEMTAQDAVARTGIPDTKIYYALEELVERGLAEVEPGRPRRYRAPPAREAVARLHQLLEARVARERAAIEDVSALLEPIAAAAREPAAELAYVVKGRDNVLRRARTLVEGAAREVRLLSSDGAFVSALEPDLLAAVRRGVEAKLAVRARPLAPELRRRADLRTIRCDCTVLVADGRRILTRNASPDGTEYAVLSADETLVRLGVEYWDSPNCCDGCG